MSGEVFYEGFSFFTTSLSLAANLGVVYWFIGWSVTIRHFSGIRNTISNTVGVSFWAAPVIAVENFRVSCGVVVIVRWVVIGALAAMKVVLFTAIATLNTFS